MKLSIIIVNFNTKDFLKECLKSIFETLKSSKLSFEVVVVDNGSTDGSVEMIKKLSSPIKLILNKENLGFARANNQGIKATAGKYILLLNSDTIVREKTLEKMVKFMDKNPQVGVSTCRVELPDGRLDPACHRGFPTPWAAFTYFSGLEKFFPKSKIFGQYHLGCLPMNMPHEIDSPSGAFYLIRRKVIDGVGLLDEDYFIYGEDIDWSYRIKQAGWKIMYNPTVKIIHFKRQSGREKKDKEIRKGILRHFYETMKIFYRKHYQKKYPRWLTKLIMLTIDLKSTFNL